MRVPPPSTRGRPDSGRTKGVEAVAVCSAVPRAGDAAALCGRTLRDAGGETGSSRAAATVAAAAAAAAAAPTSRRAVTDVDRSALALSPPPWRLSRLF